MKLKKLFCPKFYFILVIGEVEKFIAEWAPAELLNVVLDLKEKLKDWVINLFSLLNLLL